MSAESQSLEEPPSWLADISCHVSGESLRTVLAQLQSSDTDLTQYRELAQRLSTSCSLIEQHASDNTVAAAVVSTDGISALLDVCCTSQENSLLVASVSALAALCRNPTCNTEMEANQDRFGQMLSLILARRGEGLSRIVALSSLKLICALAELPSGQNIVETQGVVRFVESVAQVWSKSPSMDNEITTQLCRITQIVAKHKSAPVVAELFHAVWPITMEILLHNSKNNSLVASACEALSQLIPAIHNAAIVLDKEAEEDVPFEFESLLVGIKSDVDQILRSIEPTVLSGPWTQQHQVHYTGHTPSSAESDDTQVSALALFETLVTNINHTLQTYGMVHELISCCQALPARVPMIQSRMICNILRASANQDYIKVLPLNLGPKVDQMRAQKENLSAPELHPLASLDNAGGVDEIPCEMLEQELKTIGKASPPVLKKEDEYLQQQSRIAWDGIKHSRVQCPWKEPIDESCVISAAAVRQQIEEAMESRHLTDALDQPMNRTIYSRLYRMPADCSTQMSPEEASAASQLSTDPAGLIFSSEFESGNLSTAVQKSRYEYDLAVMDDYNTAGHTQWFYFCVQNMEPKVTYKFNIINFQKSDSQYNKGMQPLVYSERKFKEQNVGWYRTGHHICYYNNGMDTSLCHTLTMMIEFPFDADKAYLAYFVPYTLSDLQDDIAQWEKATEKNGARSEPICKKEMLCESFGGLAVPMLHISSNLSDEQTPKKPMVALSARVHPGESNGSWMMKGAIDFLLSKHKVAAQLRQRYYFVVVPMVNVDGVLLGNYRSSMAGLDLNRQWHKPSARITPEIFYWKRYLSGNKSKIVFICDLHGHSRKMDGFLYGCNNPDHQDEKLYPWLLSQENPSISYQKSRFVVQKSKRGTGRVVGWRELGVINCFTLEATFAGFTEGAHGGHQCSTGALEEIGASMVSTILTWADTVAVPKKKQAAMKELQQANKVSAASEIDDEESGGSDDDPTAGNYDMSQLVERWAVTLAPKQDAVKSPTKTRTKRFKTSRRKQSEQRHTQRRFGVTAVTSKRVATETAAAAQAAVNSTKRSEPNAEPKRWPSAYECPDKEPPGARGEGTSIPQCNIEWTGKSRRPHWGYRMDLSERRFLPEIMRHPSVIRMEPSCPIVVSNNNNNNHEKDTMNLNGFIYKVNKAGAWQPCLATSEARTQPLSSFPLCQKRKSSGNSSPIRSPSPLGSTQAAEDPSRLRLAIDDLSPANNQQLYSYLRSGSGSPLSPSPLSPGSPLGSPSQLDLGLTLDLTQFPIGAAREVASRSPLGREVARVGREVHRHANVNGNKAPHRKHRQGLYLAAMKNSSNDHYLE